MTIADNAVSLRLLEGLCAEMRARLEAKAAPQPKFLERLRRVKRAIKTTARLMILATGLSLAAGNY